MLSPGSSTKCQANLQTPSPTARKKSIDTSILNIPCNSDSINDNVSIASPVLVVNRQKADTDLIESWKNNDEIISGYKNLRSDSNENEDNNAANSSNCFFNLFFFAMI